MLRYLQDNYPSREEMLSVRSCAEGTTDYKFPPLPDNYGPHLLTSRDSELVEQAKSAPEEVHLAFTKCTFELGLEGSFYPPAEQERVREGLDPNR